MREILFRGKSGNFKRWIVGSATYFSDGEQWILVDDKTSTKEVGTGSYVIELETLGQYTGLTDENGTRIFEGDYIKMHYFFENYDPHTLGVFEDENCVEGVVICDINGFYIIDDGEMYPLSLMQDSEAESVIIGNIYDNPELIGENNE